MNTNILTDELAEKYQFINDFIADKNAQGQPVLLDGAMGTALFAQGLQTGDAPELWNVTHADKVKHIYREYYRSGSDIILTNSFGGSSARLKLHDLDSRVLELNQAAAALADEVRSELYEDGTFAKDEVKLIAASMGPLGELLQPMGPLSRDDAEEIFYQQALGMKAGGADLIWIETMALLDEVDAAYHAALRAGLPAAFTLSFDMNGKTMMGVTEQQLCDYANALPIKPVTLGFNCGLGFSDSLLTLKNLLDLAQDIPVIAKSNCGLPSYHEGEFHFDGTPELMQQYALLARDAGAKLIGGCCGTTAEHVAQMKDVLVKNPKQDRTLSRELIEGIFGAAKAPDSQENEAIDKKRQARQRRRDS